MSSPRCWDRVAKAWGSIAGSALLLMTAFASSAHGSSSTNALSSPGPACARLIAYQEGADINASKIFAVPETGGASAVLWDGPQSEVDPAWAPDGRSLAFAGRGLVNSVLADNTVQILTIGDSEPRTLFTQPSGGLRHVTWSPDGRWLAYASGYPPPGELPRGLVHIRVIPTNSVNGSGIRLVASLPAGLGLTDLAWSPKGDALLVSAIVPNQFFYSMWTVDPTSLTPELRVVNNEGFFNYPDFSRLGNAIVIEGNDPINGASTIFAADPTLRHRVQLFRVGDNEGFPAFSPDNLRVAYTDFDDNSINVLSVLSHRITNLVGAGSQSRSHLAWQPRCR